MYYEKVKQYIRAQDMLHKGDQVLAGVSGGADSMAMLDMLRRYREETAFSLAVIHVNHGIRGEEALRDQKYVESYCETWSLPCHTFAFQVPEYAREHGLGTEEAGRLLRDQAFEMAEKKYQASRKIWIALAHNQNDQAETVIHHLARGSGLKGIAGILPVSGKKIRPVLCLQRREIEAYLTGRKLAYMTDSTNQNDDYTRNRIRHHVLPFLEEQVNQAVVPHLAETAFQAALAEDYLGRQGRRMADHFRRDDTICFTGAFFDEDPILKMYAVREALYQLSGSRKDLTASHIRQVLELEHHGVSGQVSLPYRLEAVRTYDGIRIRKYALSSLGQRSDREQLLPVPGSLKTAGGFFSTRLFFYQNEKIEEKKYTKWLDYDKINSGLSVRTRKTGDFLILKEQGKHKKLNRCMIDDKIPAEIRERIPLVVSGQEVLWIVGWRMGEKYKITSNTRRVLEITYEGGTTV